MNSRLMTIKEAAQYLNLNYMTVYKLAQKGDIPASKVGGSWRFKKEILDDWLTRKTTAGRGAVLVVDDDPGCRDIIMEIVSKHGHTVVTAESGEAALKEINKQHFDLIFLDLVLPGLSGVDVLKVIKDTDKDAAVCVVTGYRDEPIAREAMSFGLLLLIAKPFRAGDISAVLRMVLKEKEPATTKD